VLSVVQSVVTDILVSEVGHHVKELDSLLSVSEERKRVAIVNCSKSLLLVVL